MKGKKMFFSVGLGLSVLIGVIALTVEVRAEKMVVADFDKGAPVTNIGSKFGAWDKDPNDSTQYCETKFSDEIKVGNSGKSLAIKYDVDSPNPAYNGIWMKLNNMNASKYKSLVLYVKGDDNGHTSTFKTELKNARESASYIVSGITSDWQKIVIPLKEYAGLTDYSALTEFVIVFDDINVTEKTGTIYVDDISFE